MRLKEPLRFQIIISQYMSKFLAMRLNEPHSQQRLIAYTCMTTNNSWYPIFCIDAEPNLGSNPRIAIKTAFAVKIQNFLQPMTTYFFLLLFFCAFAFGFFRPPPVLDFFSGPFLHRGGSTRCISFLLPFLLLCNLVDLLAFNFFLI